MNRPPVSVGSLRATPTVWPPRCGRWGAVAQAPLEGRSPHHPVGFGSEEVDLPAAIPTARAAVADERAARRDLCDQIARLERELAQRLADGFPRREPARGGVRSASAQAGPRLLGLGQLERIRDELAGRVAALRDHEGEALLAAMRAHPERHPYVQVTSAQLGLPGCRSWQVRPRLGPLGRLMGWWRVTVSSGCPLA
jgi:hypothetical protein